MFLDYGQVSSVCRPSSHWDELLYGGSEMQNNNNISDNTNTKQLLKLLVKLEMFQNIKSFGVMRCMNNRLFAMWRFLSESQLQVASCINAEIWKKFIIWPFTNQKLNRQWVEKMWYPLANFGVQPLPSEHYCCMVLHNTSGKVYINSTISTFSLNTFLQTRKRNVLDLIKQ